jgi:hypothetical protein
MTENSDDGHEKQPHFIGVLPGLQQIVPEILLCWNAANGIPDQGNGKAKNYNVLDDYLDPG